MAFAGRTDFFIIYYNRQDGRWSAFSTKTLLTGISADPKEALENALASTRGQTHTHRSAPSEELLQTLAEIAQPLPEGEYMPDIVYKYERA